MTQLKKFLSMKIIFIIFQIIFISLFSFCNLTQETRSPWITMYLPSYYQDNSGELFVQLTDEDFNKITLFSHHGPYVNKDGSFNYYPTRYTDIKGKKAVDIAHSHNIPILLCIVSWKEYLITIKTDSSRTALVTNTVRLMDKIGYDGVDVDLEPVVHPGMPEIAENNSDYILFVHELYDSLQTRESTLLGRKPMLITAVNGVAAAALSQIYTLYDQINLMTYDMSQPWEGWPVWHDAAIYDTGYRFPDVGDLHSSSVELDVMKCLDRGIPCNKIGIGMSSDAFQWKGGDGTSTGGATEPLQQWTAPPKWSRFTYKHMMEKIYQPEYYRWDDQAKMSYLSIDREDSAEDEFWSYNDERSCFEKMNYVLQNRLGGVIIWEIGAGYLSSLSDNKHLPQLDALYRTKTGWSGPSVYTLTVENGNGSGSYEPGTIIPIKSKSQSKKDVFNAWIGASSCIADTQASVTHFVMPDSSVTIRATFR